MGRRRSRPPSDGYPYTYPADGPAPDRSRSGGDVILAALRQVQAQQAHVEEMVDDLREQVGAVRTDLARLGERQENVARTLDDHAARLTTLERERAGDRLSIERERGQDRMTFAQEVAQAMRQGSQQTGQVRTQLTGQVLAMYGAFFSVIVIVLIEMIHIAASGRF